MRLNLQDFRDGLAREAFGMTRAEAHVKGICICCKQPPKLDTEIDQREYAISALCPTCFAKVSVDEETTNGERG